MMVFKISRKELEKLYKNNEISKIIEIYSACSTTTETERLKAFVKRNHDDFTEEQLCRFITTIVIDNVRKHNREEEYKKFVPMVKKMSNTDTLTSAESTFNRHHKRDIKTFINDSKNNVSKDDYIILRQIYNTEKEKCYLGLYNIRYNVDQLLEEGIPIGYKAELKKRIVLIDNFDYMLHRIISCNDEKQSNGSLLIKIPKESINNRSIPIYYEHDNSIYLDPKYIICYVPVMERKILSVEINDSNNNVESNICEGDILNKNDEKIIKR